ncbi:Dolichyl-phosphate-mannose-protein mannosyltransferase [uncultured archaeon]|nr:Dolichyl-phosphate-mannose-protein mannosyltransferase [uncultured archaeon]
MIKEKLAAALQNLNKEPGFHNIKRIFLYSYLQLSVLFVIAMFLKEMGLLPAYFLNFILFGYLLPVFALPLLVDLKNPYIPDVRIKPVYLYLSITIIFVFIIAVRLIPYAENSIPLGYDPGYYKYAIDLYLNTLPGIPEVSLPLWIKQMHEQGFFVLFDTLHIFTGIDSLQALMYLLPFLSALLVLPVFILTKRIFDEKIALLACALYAVSYTQFTAFTFMYLRNILGLFFLLFALYVLEKKRYVLIAIMFAALGIYHRPEFLIFSLVLTGYFLKNRDIKLVYSTALTAILIAPFWLPRIEIYLPIASGVSNSAIQSIQGEPAGGGTFFDFGQYEWVSLAYLPFGIIGAIYLIHRKMWNPLLFYFIINGVIVVFKLFFFNRLIINFDMVLLILASAGITYTFLACWRIPRAAGIIFICLLVISGGVVTLQKAREIKPLMSENQIESLEWLSGNTEGDAYILATSYDAPWALAWGKRRVLAPGLFEWDNNGRDKWLEFLATGDPSKAEDFLKKHDAQVYIFYSFNKFNWMNLEKFNNSSFTKISMKDSVVYSYDGNK